MTEAARPGRNMSTNGISSKLAAGNGFPGKPPQKRAPIRWLVAVAMVALLSLSLMLAYQHQEPPEGEENTSYITAIWAMEDQAGKAVWNTLLKPLNGGGQGKGSGSRQFAAEGSGQTGKSKGEGGRPESGNDDEDNGDDFEELEEDKDEEAERGSEQVVRQRKLWRLEEGENFMWYGVHAGFGNQVIQLRWALRIAGLLNRTLILPPMLPHFNRVPSIGSCAKRPTPVALIRAEAWKAYSALLADPAYVSIGDMLDMRRLPPSLVRTIDFRHFVARYCGCFVGRACQGPWCFRLSKNLLDPATQAKCLRRCGAKLGGLSREEGSQQWVRHKHLYMVPNTCGDTVWTLGKYSRLQDLEDAVGEEDPNLLPFVHALGKRGSSWPEPLNLLQTLGPGTEAGEATVMAFGSTFHPRIGDMSLPGWPKPMELLRNVSQVLPFTPEIMHVGKEFARQRIGKEFACLHLRTADGSFMGDLDDNLRLQEAAVKKMHATHTAQRDENGRLVMFVMTDLQPERWNGTYLARLKELGFESLTGAELQKEVEQAGKETVLREYGLFANRVERAEADKLLPPGGSTLEKSKEVKLPAPQDVALFVEQTICSCAALGFLGTPKSTASGHVNNMRAAKFCQEEAQG